MSISKGSTVRLKNVKGVPTRYHGRTGTVVSRPQNNNRIVVEVSAREKGKPNQTRLLALNIREVRPTM